MNRKTTGILTAIASLMLATASHAAIVTYVGAEFNVDPTSNDLTIGWHSNLNAKPLDIDGDNILGSDYWIRTKNGASGINNPERYIPVGGYVVAYAGGGVGHAGATAVLTGNANSGAGFMDLPTTGAPSFNPATESANASWHGNGTANNVNLFRFTIQNDNLLTGKTLRVGVLFDASNLTPGANATQSMAITQTAGGGGFAASPQLDYRNNGLDVAYFDLTGLMNGDAFVISADADGTNARSHIAGITFDSAVVTNDIPEPSSVLMGLAGLAMIALRRRSE